MNNNPNMNPIILFFRKYIAGADPGVGAHPALTPLKLEKAGIELPTVGVIGTYIGTCISYYHAISAMMASIYYFNIGQCYYNDYSICIITIPNLILFFRKYIAGADPGVGAHPALTPLKLEN
jgi:hypothetical protein